MNQLVSLIQLDPSWIIVFGLGAFLAFAVGFWFLAGLIRGWHPAFQTATVIGLYLFPLSAADAFGMLAFGQICVGLTANRAFEWYRRIMYRRGFPLF